MLLSLSEIRCEEHVDGSIIDLETVGDFISSRGLDRYREIQPISLGFFFGNTLQIIALRGFSKAHKSALRDVCRIFLSTIPRPFYAYNTDFEMGVLYWFLNENVQFDRDLMLKVRNESGTIRNEKKKHVVKDLSISNFDDPFYDEGYRVLSAWQKFKETNEDEHIRKIMRHNRACLLKEYWILKKRLKWRTAKSIREAD